MSINQAISLFFILLSSSIFGQQNYNYQAPLDLPLVLAANFGELRPHHFHMGLDFKTNSKEGYSIRSIQSGHVSRIKISRSGYGKAVYIDHGNGHTSVYAHCSAFKGQIDSLVRKVQEREQNAEVEIYLKKDEIKVKRGQIIALSGNTGGSSGPHLHFELRETATEIGLNPLLHGFHIADHKAPEIRGVKISALDSNGFTLPGKSLTFPVKKSHSGNYALTENVKLPSHFCSKNGGIGLAFEVIDRYDDAPNTCGMFASELKVNGDLLFSTKIDKIPFDESRHINCHKDHGEFLKGKDYHRCFQTSENILGIYEEKNKGIIEVQPGDELNIQFSTWDVKKNQSVLVFNLQIEKGLPDDKNHFPSTTYFLPKDKIELTNGVVFITAEPNTVYEPLKKSFSLEPPYFLGENKIPVQKALFIAIPSIASKKHYLELSDEKNRKKFISVNFHDGNLNAYPKNLGRYTIKIDTVPPQIKPIDIKSSQLRWYVKEYETEISEYDLFINGKWVLLEYESKSDLLFATKPQNLKGDCELELIVTDICGNQVVWKTKMTF